MTTHIDEARPTSIAHAQRSRLESSLPMLSLRRRQGDQPSRGW